MKWSKVTDLIRLRKKSSLYHILPPELLALIITFISLSDLVSVIQTCRGFRAIAEPLLYRDINVCDYPIRSLHVLSTLSKRPHLAQYVKSFDNRNFVPFSGRRLLQAWTWRRNVRFRSWTKKRRFFAEGELKSFKNMKNLESVVVGCGGEMWSTYRYSVSNAVSQMRLRKIVFSSEDLPFEGCIDAILQNQPLLEHLELPRGMTEARTLAPTDIPLLNTFVGDVLAALSIVPGRPVFDLTVKHLEYIIAGLQWDDLFPRLRESTVPITSLSLKLYRPFSQTEDAMIVRIVAKYFKEIRNLVVDIMFGTGLRQLFFATVAEALGSFHNLESIKFSCSPDSFFPPDEEEEDIVIDLAFIRSWGARCGSLRQLELDDVVSWTRDDGSENWKDCKTQLKQESKRFSRDLKDNASWPFLWRDLDGTDP